MDIVKIAGVCMIAVVLFAILKQIKPEFGLVVLLACTVLLSIWGLLQADKIISFMKELGQISGIPSEALQIILKCIGIAFVAETSSEICRDGNLNALGDKIQWIGKILIFLEIIPFIRIILDVIKDLLIG